MAIVQRPSEVRVVPLRLREANQIIGKWHRHHVPVRGCVFTLGAELDGEIVGVATVGRPVARLIDFRKVAEVTRLCTNGQRNACSLLYGAAARVATEMGYERIQTYILASEPGTSLRAAGWRLVRSANASAKQWDHSQAIQLLLTGGTRRPDSSGPKVLWERILR